MRCPPSLLSLSFGIALLGATASHAAPIPPLIGPNGDYDYAAVDPVHHQLYVARSKNVTAYDLATHGPARSLGAINHGHAVIPIDGGKTLFVTSGADNSVRFLDAADGRETARLAVGTDPDGAVVDEAGQKAYVMNAKDGTVSAIDLASRTVVGSATLKPGLEAPALAGSTLFVNNAKANEIETVNVDHMKPGPSIALPGCTRPSGLAYDRYNQFLIAACDNKEAAVVSLKTGRLSLLSIGIGPDAVLLDPARHRAFIPCGRSASLDIVALNKNGRPKIVGHLKSATGARTGALDQISQMIYLPTARLEPPAPGIRRGAMVPGSFAVLQLSGQ